VRRSVRPTGTGTSKGKLYVYVLESSKNFRPPPERGDDGSAASVSPPYRQNGFGVRIARCD